VEATDLIDNTEMEKFFSPHFSRRVLL
jgi:hypothetical protein